MASTSTETLITGVLIKAEQTNGILIPSEVSLLVKYIYDLEDNAAKLSIELAQKESKIFALLDKLNKADAIIEGGPSGRQRWNSGDL